MIWLYLSSLFLCFICSLSEVERPRGVAISKASLYDPSKDFSCLDGHGVVPFARINDDYCDCKDGSDEPGTPACPNGSFHCTNSGYKPKYMPSSRVNDGICDCCDGTDEYNGKVTCANYCRELGRQFREEEERTKKLMDEGHNIYKEYSQKGQEAKKENEARLEQAKAEKDELEIKKNDMESRKLEVEEPEREAKKRHEDTWAAEKEKRKEAREKEEMEAAFKVLDTDGDNSVSVSEIQSHPEFDIDSNGAVSVEEAKEYLNDEEFADFDTFRDKVWVHIKDVYREPGSEQDTAGEAEQAQGDEGDEASDEEDDDEDDAHPDPEDYDVDDDEDDDDDYEEEDKKDSKDEEMPEYDEDTKALIQAADNARAAFNEVNSQFKELEKEIKELETLVSIDFGSNEEFYPLRGECFEFSDREYTYKMCPFEKCSQRNKHGGTETSLGTWGNWDGGEGEDRYKVMKFEKGQNCWNGPDRFVRAKLECSLHNELVAVSEPNRCEYEYTFKTPARCNRPPQATSPDPRDEL